MAWRSAEEWLSSGEGEAGAVEHVWVLQLGAVEQEIHTCSRAVQAARNRCGEAPHKALSCTNLTFPISSCFRPNLYYWTG